MKTAIDRRIRSSRYFGQHHRPAAIPFTDKEWAEKKYTLQDALNAATVVCSAKTGLLPICVTSVQGRCRNEPITLVELNTISEQIVLDTIYHR